MYDINAVREEFPILNTQVHGKPLIYLDNGATTQKPRCVVKQIEKGYYENNANIHRGVHRLSQLATEAHENARGTVQRFLNAAHSHEIIFTRGTTEAINLVAQTFCDRFMHPGDEVIISTMEHHSNIVAWQLQAERRGIVIRVIPMDDKGDLDIEQYSALFNERTKLVSVMHISNVLGTVNPVEEMINIAHSNDVPILIDGAQSVAHTAVDVQKLDADFYAFSAHKIYGPTGIGVLYGKEKWLNELPPYQGGGEMIATVSFEKTTFNELPFKFEAGTPDYIGSTALAMALDYVSTLGLSEIAKHEHALIDYAVDRLREIPQMRIIGEPANRNGIVSFLVGDIHPYDMGMLLDRLGIAIRTGHHCAQPLMQRLGIDGTMRASVALYNTTDEIDTLIAAINRVRQMF